MKSTSIIEHLDKLAPSTEEKEAMLQSIFDRADTEAAKERIEKMKMHRTKKKINYRRFVPAMAAVIAIAGLMCVPSIGQAVMSWAGRLFSPHSYFGAMPEDRIVMEDVEKINQRPADNKRDKIMLLSDTEKITAFNAARRENGFPEYNAADWQWLKACESKIEDVVYDGGKLYITSSLRADPRLFFDAHGDMLLDWIALDATAIQGGEEYTLRYSSTGIQPQQGYFNGGSANAQAMEADDRVMLLTVYDMDEDNIIPEGQYTVVQRSAILDRNIDPMADFATVAYIEQGCFFDTAKGGLSTDVKGHDGTFKGSYPLTVWDMENDTYYNTVADLAEVSVKADFALHTTGVTATLTYSFPESWTKAQRTAFAGNGLNVHDGMEYDLVIDGQKSETLMGEFSFDAPERVTVEIPLTEAQRDVASVVALCPLFGYSTSVMVEGSVVSDLSKPYSVPSDKEFDGEHQKVELYGCELYVPVR